jgi:hypothetical protein
MAEARFRPLTSYREYPVDEMRERAKVFYEDLRRRRTVREFYQSRAPQEWLDALAHRDHQETAG